MPATNPARSTSLTRLCSWSYYAVAGVTLVNVNKSVVVEGLFTSSSNLN